VICDSDDLPDGAMGMTALVARGWGEAVRLIVLSWRADVEEIAGAFGAIEGLRKPINVGRLMTAIDQHVRDGRGFPDA
jgi:hypothetical protein